MKSRDERPPRPRAARRLAGPPPGAPDQPSPSGRHSWGPPARPVSPLMTMHTLRGIAVSSGVAIGPALVIDPRGPRLPHRAIAAEAVAAELERLDRGLSLARTEAEAAEASARARLGPQYADILGAHAQMIADPTLRNEARRRVAHNRISAEHAVTEVLHDHAAKLEAIADPYLAARAADVRDIEQRILFQLSGQRPAAVMDQVGEPDRKSVV